LRPAGSYTFPEIVVEPASQRAIWQTRPPLHVQTLLVHVVPAGHASVQGMEPPQPSPTVPPQYWPPVDGLQVSLAQLVSPLHRPLLVSHTLPVPQLVEQSMLPPQLFPILPQ
jgi:hypothetical protein